MPLTSPHARRLAGFYDWYLAVTPTGVWEWTLQQQARQVPGLPPVAEVAVAEQTAYAVDTQQRLWTWQPGQGIPRLLHDGVQHLAAGESSLLAIRTDGSLWQRLPGAAPWLPVAPQALRACVGDSSDYYIDARHRLWATGRAHRGQYGNGQLEDATGWVQVAEDAADVVAHTGHAVFLRRDGAVLGTGGNRFGPLGRHGFGDKADRWGVLFDGTERIATGSRHTLALRADGTLWGWGDADGLAPRLLQTGVADMAAGASGSASRTTDGRLWRWQVGQAPAALHTPVVQGAGGGAGPSASGA